MGSKGGAATEFPAGTKGGAATSGFPAGGAGVLSIPSADI